MATAQAAALAAYHAAVASFNDDLTTVAVEPFQWQQPQPLPVPSSSSDATQPSPPAPKPTYSGPAYSFDSDPVYQAEFHSAEAVFQAASSAANSLRRQQNQLAKAAYDAAVADIHQDEVAARQAANTARSQAASTAPQTDMQAEFTAYQQAVQVLYDDYHDAVGAASRRRADQIDPATAALHSGILARNAAFSQTHTAAWQAYQRVVNRPGATQAEKNAALDSYQQTMLAAGQQRDLANAQAQHAHELRMINVNFAHTTAQLQAQQTLAAALEPLAQQYEDAVAQRAAEIAQRNREAQAASDEAIADASFDSRIAIAAATRAYAEQLAQNAHAQQLAIESARSLVWVAQSTAARDALYRWNQAVATPWTAYQLELGNARLTLGTALQAAHQARAVTIANATQARAYALAAAEQVRTVGAANQQHENALVAIDARSGNQQIADENAASAADANTDHRSVLTTTISTAELTRATEALESSRTYATTLADARLAYSTTMIGARRIGKGVLPSTAANASATLSVARNNAHRTLATDQINQGASFNSTARAAWSDFNHIQDQKRLAEQNAYSASQQAAIDAITEQNASAALDELTRQTVYDKAVHAATFAYVQATAPADQLYQTSVQADRGTANVTEATALAAYYQAEATAYRTIIGIWDNATQSAWSQLHDDQTQGELQWAIDTGAAGQALAISAAQAEDNRTTTLANISLAQTLTIALAAQSRDDSLADQRLAFATTIINSKRDDSLVVATINQEQQDQEAEWAAEQAANHRAFADDHANQAADAELAFQLAMLNLNTDYSNAAALANAALHGTIGDSWEAYVDSNYTQSSQHESTVNSAVSSYNTAMSAATDAYNTGGQAATQAVSEARQELFASWREHQQWGSPPSQLPGAPPIDEPGILAQGDSSRDLAQAILDATVTLANARWATLNAYADTAYGADAAASINRTAAENSYRTAINQANGTSDTAIATADGHRRIAQLDARGAYEVAWYNGYAAEQTALIGSGNPLAASAAAAATTKAIAAANINAARSSYETAVLTATLARLTSTRSATGIHTTAINAAESVFTIAVTPAYTAHSLAIEYATNQLAADKTIAEAIYDKAVTVQTANQNQAAALAWGVHDTAIRDANEIRVSDIAGAYDTFYGAQVGTLQWHNRVWNPVNASYYGYDYYYGGYYDYGYYGYGYYDYGYYGYVGSYGWGYSYGYGGFGIGGYYGGYGYAGLGYGWGYGFGYGYGWGGYGWGYGVSYLGTATPGSIDDLNDHLADAQEDFDAAAQAAHIARVTSLADDAITKATNLDAAYRLLVQTQGDADVAYATAVGHADVALETALQPAYLARTTAVATADKNLADALQNAVVTQTTTLATLDNSYQSLWATAAVAQATGIATAEIDGWIASQTAAAASAQATALASGTAADLLAAVQAQATVAGLQALRPGYIASQQNHAAADANLSVSLTAATGARHVSNETATRDFLQAAGHAQRLREIADEAASGLYYHSLALADASRQIAAAANQADYRLDAATAQGIKQIADAQAAKTRDLALAADPDAYDPYDPYGYPTSTATDDYQKAAADSELARQLSLAAALQLLQVDDAVSRRDYTIAEANANDAYDRSLALAAKTFRDSVATAQRTRATADANTDRTYSLAAAAAERNHRVTLSNANTAGQVAIAAADVAAYGHVHQEYDLPYTNYLHGLATLRQSLTSQLVPAAGTLTTDRNATSATHATTVADAARVRDLAFADASRDRELAASSADYQQTIGQLDATAGFYAAVSVPAVAYATAAAAANQARTAALATAERDFQYQQADGNQQAYSNRQAAITAADNVRDLALATAESSWWSAEAGAHADRAVADAAADHAWTIATLAADQSRLVAEGQAQKSLRDTQATAYHTAETAWVGYQHAFYLAEVNASAALTSGLQDPWSIRDDSLRASRAASDRDQLIASKNRSLAALDAQKTLELAVSGAQQTILVSTTANQQTQGAAQSAAYLQLATALASAYRNQHSGGSQLVLAAASAALPTPLAIASQIGFSLSVSGWQAVSQQLIDRIEHWASRAGDQLTDQALDLGASALDSIVPSLEAVSISLNTAYSMVDGWSVPERTALPSVEPPPTDVGGNGHLSHRDNAIALTLATSGTVLLPQWATSGAINLSLLTIFGGAKEKGRGLAFFDGKDLPEMPAHYTRVTTEARLVESWTSGKYEYEVIKDGEDYTLTRSQVKIGLWGGMWAWKEGGLEKISEKRLSIQIKGDHKVPELAYLQISKRAAVENVFTTLNDVVTEARRIAVVGFIVGTAFIPGPEDVVLATLAIRHGITATRVNGALELAKDGKKLTGKDFDEAIELAKDIGRAHATPVKGLTTYGKNAIAHFRSHSQHIRETARKLGIEIPKGPSKPETLSAMKDFIDKVVNAGAKKTGKFKDVLDAEWYKLGDAIVIRRPDGEWLSFLDYSKKSPLSNLWDSM